MIEILLERTKLYEHVQKASKACSFFTPFLDKTASNVCSDVKGENLHFTTKSALFYGNTPRCNLNNHIILFLSNKQGNKSVNTTIKKRKKKKKRELLINH